MAKQYVYEIGGKLYANLTNRCSNACTFCVRNYDTDRKKPHGYEGYDLWLEKEPTADEVVAALEKYDLTKYKELVFCGYGEPTYRFDVLEEVAAYAHKKSLRTRINTNGQANAILGKDVSERMCRAIDVIGISLNEVRVCKAVRQPRRQRDLFGRRLHRQRRYRQGGRDRKVRWRKTAREGNDR